MWYLPESEKYRFKEPFGILFSDMDKALAYIGDAPIYAVGDVVSANLKKRGIIPKLSVIDGNTMRTPYFEKFVDDSDSIDSKSENTNSTRKTASHPFESASDFCGSSNYVIVKMNVTNPAGTITQELIDVLIEAVKLPHAIVHIDGEEDLAVIPLVMILPEKSAVIYGQPNQGVVAKILDENSQKHASELFSVFRKKV